MTGKSKKTEIERLINEGKIDEAEASIAEYEKCSPADADLCSLKTAFYLAAGDADTAYIYASEGVRRLPLNEEMQYNYAVTCEMTGRWAEAYIAYCRSGYLIDAYKKTAEITPFNDASRLINAVQDELQNAEASVVKDALNQIRALGELSKNGYSLCEGRFRTHECPDMIGDYFYETIDRRRFVGYFRDQFFVHFPDKAPKDVMRMKAEFLEVDEGREYNVSENAKEYIVPIASSENVNNYAFISGGKEQLVRQSIPNTFSYYRVKGGTKILSGGKSYFGKEIPLQHSEKRKKLVLSIFVDGVSSSVVKGKDFEKHMPYTASFFEKGMVFTSAYNAGEWTFPSIANYVTGLSTPKHMLYHPTMDYLLPEDITTLAEYYQQAGYYTSYYGGDWRIIPTYGHARGFDRYVYQHQKVGFKVHDVIADVINQIDAFSETDQYIWVTIGDLHDIADGDEFATPVQTSMDIEERVISDRGSTSVKQSYNEIFKKQYLRNMHYVDRWLHYLYDYIESNYKDEEILISLFSDHGQGYLIEREDAHFLSEERSNVPILFRGGESTGKGYCSELISSTDYSVIMRKLTNLNSDVEGTDGHLPRILGGEQKREYVLTESIHPGDPYQAAIFTENGNLNYFYHNSDPVHDDARFELTEQEEYLEDEQGCRVEDERKLREFHSILMEHIAGLLIYDN